MTLEGPTLDPPAAGAQARRPRGGHALARLVMVQRVLADFRMAILVVFGLCALGGIAPFAVYRFWSGDVAAGLLDTAILSSLVGASGYALFTGRTRGAALLCVAVCTLGVALITRKTGYTAALWLYPALVSNFLLVARRHALLAALASIVGVLANHALFPSALMLSLFVSTGLLVSLFSYIFARVTERQRALLEQVANRDALTGAPNRRALDHDLLELRCGRAVGVPALLLLDLDHFKRINDAYGHAEGDRVLVEFASLLNRSIRLPDKSYRLGGEEFVVLLPEATPETAAAIAERLRRRTHRDLRVNSGAVTVSIGVALRRPGEAFEHWLRRADQALYRAKGLGRNTVVSSEDDPAVASAQA